MIRTLFPAADARGSFRWLGLLGLAALVAATLAAQPAQAGQVTASSEIKYSGIPTVTFTLITPNSTISKSVGAGVFRTTFHTSNVVGISPGDFLDTYCVDLDVVVISGNAPGEVSAVDGIKPDAETGLDRNIGAAGWVLSNYGVYEGSGAGAGLANALGLSPASLTDRQAEAAIQVAIWMAAYDSAATNVSSGTILKFTTIDAKIAAAANKILENRGSNTALVGFLDYPPLVSGSPGAPINQDQIFLLPEGGLEVIPEPSTLAMAAFGGLIGLGMVGRKRLRARKVAA